MIFASILFYLLSYILYYDYTTTHFFAWFMACLTPGARSSGSIGHNYLIQKRTINPINGGGKGFK